MLYLGRMLSPGGWHLLGGRSAGSRALCPEGRPETASSAGPSSGSPGTRLLSPCSYACQRQQALVPENGFTVEHDYEQLQFIEQFMCLALYNTQDVIIPISQVMIQALRGQPAQGHS